MQIDDDSPLDHTPDLVAKVRKLREEAEKQMNQFTHAGDYDIRRVVGQKPKAEETEPAAPADGGAKKRRVKSSPDQNGFEFSPAPVEQDEEEGDQ